MAGRGDPAAVEALLDRGADVDAKDIDGRTALMLAIQNGHLDVVKALIAKGADVNAKDNVASSRSFRLPEFHSGR